MWWPWRWLWETLEHLEPCDVCAGECVWWHRTTKTNWEDYAHIHVFMLCRTFTCSCCASCSCFSGSWFSRCHWCRTCQRSASWSSIAFHHTHAIPSAEFFPSGCCSPIVSCHRPLNLYTKFLHISHRENGSFEVLSLHPPAVNDLGRTRWQAWNHDRNEVLRVASYSESRF